MDRLPAVTAGGDVLAVIEATRYTPAKLKFDAELGTFVLHQILPAGMSYPYDFGFVPSTRAEDGDPLDIMVLNDEPIPVGGAVRCRLVGVLLAEQEVKGRRVRNDRLVAVASMSRQFGAAHAMKDIAAEMLDSVERFFVDYNRERGVRFEPMERQGASRAAACLRKAIVDRNQVGSSGFSGG